MKYNKKCSNKVKFSFVIEKNNIEKLDYYGIKIEYLYFSNTG